MNVQPFHPTPGSTVNLTASNSSTPVLLGGQPSSPGTFQIRLYNSGSVVAFVRQGDFATVAATTTKDAPLAPGAIEVWTVNGMSGNGLGLAAITASGTTTIYITTGAGL